MKRRIFGSCFVTIILFCGISAKNNSYSRNGNGSLSEDVDYAESAFVRKKWLSQLFFEAQAAFTMDPAENTECKKDFDLFKLHLRNHSTWAVKMMESSEWPLAGILSGTVDYMGNYDECLAISSYSISGRYCLARVAYDYSDAVKSEVLEEPDQRISAWNTLTMYEKNPSRVNRKRLTFALCIPSSCASSDLNASLNNLLYPVFKNNQLNVTIDVDSMFCKTQNDVVYSTGYYIVTWSFVMFFLFVIFSSFYDTVTSDEAEKENSDADKRKRHFFNEVSEIFSLSRNFRKLKQCSSKDYAVLYFTKVLNIIFTIYGHRVLYILNFPSSNAVKERFFNIPILMHMNAIVDSFFFVTGFLTFYYEFQPMKKGGRFFLFTNIFLRWIRMVSVFGVLMVYIIYVFPSIGDGPLWNYAVMSEVNNCRETWWAGLFAINNIVRTDQQCLLASWYISVDIQLAIIGGILLYIMSKNTKIGIFAVGVTFIASILVTFIIAYENQLYGHLRVYLDMFKDIRTNNEFTDLYVATVTRCGPYLMGFIVAYVIPLLNKNKIKFTNNQIYLCSFLAILIGEACSFYGYSFYAINRQYDRFENAFYAALNHVVVMSPYAVLCCFYFTSGLGIFTKMVEWKVWIPFGRLTYSVYLINTVVQLYHVSSQRQPFVLPGGINFVWWFLGDLIWCYLMGLVLYLFVEAPVLNLKTLLKKQLSKLLVKSKAN